MQGTGGSTAMAKAWEQMRQAGRDGARDAGRSRGARVERARRGDHRRRAASFRTAVGPAGDLRRARVESGGAHAARAGDVEGPEGLQADRQAACRASTARPRPTARRSSLMDFSLPGHAHRADRAAAALRGHRQVGRRDCGAAREGRDRTSCGCRRASPSSRPASGRRAKGREALRVTWDESRAERVAATSCSRRTARSPRRPGTPARA